MNDDKYALFRIRLEDKYRNDIQNMANEKDELVSNMYSNIAEWFSTERQQGRLPARYYASPNSPDPFSIWINRSTADKIRQLARDDDNNGNRVLYTAIIRYLER